jgi:hypothetical protein
MKIDGLFQSPAKYVADFARIQTILYRHDASLQDYFHPLQMDTLDTPRASSRELNRANGIRSSALHRAFRLGASGSRRRIKTDVLICPNQHFGRRSETLFFFRTVLGVAETGARILCLIPDGTPARDELEALLSAAGRKGQVEYLDVTATVNPVEARVAPRMSKKRAHDAFEQTVQLLEPHGLGVGREMIYHFEHRARYVDAWERIAPSIDFDAAIVRCHWQSVSSSLCRTAAERGKTSITYQQGVIGHTLDVPVTTSKYVAFGDASAYFLAQCDRRFFEAVGKPQPPVEYINGGCLFDTIFDLRNQFDQRSLLLVDIPAGQSDFYGVEEQCAGLLELAERLLAADLPLRKIIIRPHPFWSDLNFEGCHRLIRKYPLQCELSHPSWSLEDDMRRSSIVAGIFSGVLTVAAACGLPTIFLQTKNGYSTGDLDCFSPDQTLLPDAAFRHIAKALSDPEAYADAQTIAMQNARSYYADGKNLDFGAASFERLLRTETATAARQGSAK